MDYEYISNLVIEESDAGDNITIKQYLEKLLLTLWYEGEGFSGKRPFGNSAWYYELYKPLLMNKIINGSLDEDGYIEDVDKKAGYEVIKGVIKHLLGKEKNASNQT